MELRRQSGRRLGLIRPPGGGVISFLYMSRTWSLLEAIEASAPPQRERLSDLCVSRRATDAPAGQTRDAADVCTCVEESGTTGCGASAPAGVSCEHSYGGVYAHLACSGSYQCVDGSWRARSTSTSCSCVEESGTLGCGA